jgi:anti-sigma B factor antagonist
MQIFILSPSTLALRLASNFGSAQAAQFRDAIRKALARAPRELLIDCSQVTYIDSTGLGLLALAQNEAVRLGGQVKLANVLNAHVRNLFALMQYEQLFSFVNQNIPTNAEVIS